MAPGAQKPSSSDATPSTLPNPKRINIKFTPEHDAEPHYQADSESSDHTPSPIGSLPDIDNMSKEALEKRIQELKMIKARHLRNDNKDGSQEPLSPQDDTGTVTDSSGPEGELVPALSSTPPAPTPSPLTATPPPPTPSPLTSPERELTMEERLALSDSDFEKWVMSKFKETGGMEEQPMSVVYSDDEHSYTVLQASGEQPLPDVWNGESFFPPVEEVFPPEVFGTANSFPPDPDVEAARRTYIELNGKFYDINEESMNSLESYGFDVRKLRSAVDKVRMEEIVTDPTSKPVLETILHSLSLGIRAFDTSPYYDPSEILLGAAFSDPALKSLYPRSELILMTKCGRITSNKFDYSPPAIRSSVLRSLDRFSTTYLDVVFTHDVEFVSREEALVAVKTLFEMKDEGLIRHVGISGYPPALLADIAVEIREKLGRAVDVVQTYCHMNIQNTTLEKSLGRFYGEAGVGVVLNASPLCMGLLRKGGVPVGELGDFHPAPRGLREKAAEAADWVEAQAGSMASLSLRFAVGEFARVDERGFGVTILGGGSIAEIEENVETVKKALKSDGSGLGDLREYTAFDEQSYKADEALFKGVRDILGEWVDYTWDSPDAAFLEEHKKQRETN
ncbi:hypothetical protein TWF281_000394 [Arthrobotrys megalospora]